MTPLSLFQGYGIEIEYPLVDAETLDVRPWVDRLLRHAAGTERPVADHDDGDIGWSNELVNHVVELKTAAPVPSLAGVDVAFDESLDRAQVILERWGARLMPTGMHPWMDPAHETRLWPHEGAEIYRTYDRIFHCRRHGWANVQSVHLNLPFADEREFARLYAAARIVLPLVPALAASSPFQEGRATGMLDTRLHHYRSNSSLVPAMTGSVVPEPLETYAEYRALLARIDAGLLPHDRERVLIGHEWTNARGAIARFDRMAVEVRLIDTQECPRADLAVAGAVSEAIRALVEERHLPYEEQRAVPVEPLRAMLDAAVVHGPAVELVDPLLARALGANGAGTLGDLWARFLERAPPPPAGQDEALERILSQGVLAQRILRAAGDEPDRETLRGVYAELCACLASGLLFAA